jgi:mannose-6-phosphate isomerase-like protein (cupin superfamily)
MNMQRATLTTMGSLIVAATVLMFAQGQQGKSPGVTYFTVADQQNLYQQTVPDKTFHQGALVVDAGDYNIGINAQHQIGNFGDGGRDGRWSFHEKVTEIYFIIEGTGTSITVGGPMKDVKRTAYSTEEVRKSNGQGMAGPGGTAVFTNSPESRKVQKGDVLIIPPFSGHDLINLSVPFRFLVVRVDPDRTLPTGFVNKYLK